MKVEDNIIVLEGKIQQERMRINILCNQVDAILKRTKETNFTMNKLIESGIALEKRVDAISRTCEEQKQ